MDNEIEDFDTFFNRYTKSDSPDGGIAVVDKKTPKKKDDEDSFETFFQKYTGQPATPELDQNVTLSRSEYKPVEPAIIGSGPLGSGNFIKPAPSTHATEIDQFAGIPYTNTEQRDFARTLFQSYSDPEKLKEIQEKVPWYMPTDAQLKVLQTRDNERTTKQVLGDMASVFADVGMNAPGIVGDVLEGGYGIAKGLGQGALAAMQLPTMPFIEDKEVKDRINKSIDEGVRSGRVLADAALLTGEAITDSAKRMVTGGNSYMDWVLGKTGKRSEEELFNNYKARYAARVADNDAKEVNPAVLARFTKWLSNQQFYVPPEDIGYVDLPRPEEVAAMGTPVVRNLGAAIIGQFTPSIEERLARHNGDRAAAALEKQTEDMSAAGSMIDSAIENANRLVEDPKQIGFVQITTPLQEFAVAGMAAKGLGAGVKAGIQGIREAGKTAEEISALRSAAAASALGKTRDAAASLEKAGMLERPLEFLAKGIENVGEKGAKAFEALPEGVRPFVTHGAALAGLGGLGAGFGSLVDEKGAGVGLGLLGYGALKGPGIAANLLKAQRMSAGKIGMLETAQMMPELRKATQRAAAVFGGKAGDWVINNAKDLIKNQIHMTPLAMALGVYNDQDAKGMVQTMAEGGVLALGHQLFAKALGKDPTAIERQRKARNIAAEKALIAASPEHRSNVDNLNWDRVVEQRQSMAQAMAKAHARAAAENPDSPEAQFLFSEKQRAQNLYQEALGASVETRKRFAEEMRGYFADAEAHVNGALSPGSNTKIEVLTSEQIKERLKNNNQAPLTPEQLEPYMSRGMRISGGRPADRPWFGNLQDQIIINYDKLVKDARFSGDALPTVLSHEIGHDLWKRNEYKKLMMPVYIELFGNEVRDENGNVITGKAGAYSDERLFSMYGDKYLAGRTPEEVKEFAIASNLWDAENNTINKPAAVQYMKEEVLADSTTGDLFAPPDSPLRSALKWAEAKATNAQLKNVLRALNTIGVDPFQAQTTGVVFSPEVRNMVREANRLIEKHNGIFEEVDPENPNPEPVITKKDLLASRDLLQKYHSDSGKFVTTPSLVVIDADGTVIGKRPITTPNVYEGQWDYNEDELGEVKATRKRGYGPLPPEAEGMNIPAGATVRVEREIAFGKDGKPIEKSNSQTRDDIAERNEAIRAAIVGAADGTPGEVKPFTASGMSLRGKLTERQRAAVMALPESIVPLSIKEKLFKVMDTIAKDDGSRLNTIYAARLNDRGGYTPFAPEMRDFSPVSITFSKDGNFLANTFSVSGLTRKLKLWEQHMPGKFAPWNGNMEAFKSDFQKYLKNWEPIWEDADGNRRPRPGQSGLDANPEIALAKKNVFNDLIGVASEEYNPELSELPRRKFTSAQRKRAKQSDPNTIFRSYRLDAMTDLLDSPTPEKYRIDYGLAKINFMPEGAEGVEGVDGIRDVNTAAEERPEARGTTILSSNPNATNATYVPPTNEGVQFRPEGAKDPLSNMEGEFRLVPTQEELDAMKARLPKYSSTTKISGNKNNLYMIKLFDEDSNQIGYAYATKYANKDSLEVESTYIEGDYRNKGYGQALYRELAKLAQKLELPKLTSSTTSRLAANARSRILETNWKGAGWNAESNVPSDVQFSPEKLNTEYAAAHEAGDEKTARELVRQAAAQAGYSINGKHGTTHNFTVFNLSRANPENDMGKGFYFSTSPNDAKINYAGKGPDLTNRIELKAEQIFNGFESSDIESFGGEAAAWSKAKNLAESELIGKGQKVIDAFISLKKPLIIGGKDETKFDVYFEPEDIEPSGSVMDLVKSIQDIGSKYFVSEEAQKAVSDLLEIGMDYEEVGAKKAIEVIKKAFNGVYDPDSGDYATNEIARKVLEGAGFDGIVDNTVNDRFGKGRKYGKGMDGMDESTQHIIAFNPESIKSADPFTYDDAGNLIPLSERFNKDTADIRFMPDRPTSEKLNAERVSAYNAADEKSTGKLISLSKRLNKNTDDIRFMPNVSSSAEQDQPQQININDTRRRDKDFGIRSESAGDRRGPRTVRGYSALAGAPNVYGRSGPIEKISRIADQYAEDRGIPIRKQAEYVKVDRKRAERIAEAYAAMPNDPQNPAVKEAYEDLIRQTKDQYDALVDSGYEFYFIDPANDPYEAKPWKAMLDLRENERMAVFPTEAGFGSGDTELDVSQNPLIGDSGLKWPFGKPDGPLKRVTWNDIFRAVHDAFGHGIEGAGFRADGEENAWQAHVRLFTGPAVGAMTSETRGQNSWLNFGPHAEKNKTASVEETIFADQKTGLMPEWTWQEGVAEDEPLLATQPKRNALEGIQLDVQFMAEKKKKSPAEKLQEKIRKAEKIDAGDLVSLPVLQEKEKGKLKFDKNGDPKIIEEGYKLLNSPEITKFSGGVVEDATLPEWDSLAYDVPKKAKKMIEDAILSGAIDAVVNRAVEKTAKYLENPEIAAGMGWYSRMRENLLNALGVEKREILSQLLGATSAKTPVNENFLQAMDALEGILSGRYDYNRKAYLEMMAAEEKADLNSLIKKERYVEKIEDKIKQLEVDAKKLSGKKQKQAKTEISKLKELISVPEDSRTKKQRLKIAVFGGDIMPLRSNGKKFNANSMAVMKVIAGTWLDNRNAPKTPNFAGNLSGRTVQATIDVWAARFLRQMLYERSGKPWRIQPKSETGVTNQDFALGQIIMERMAKKLKMNPDDLQAVLWFAEKDNWEKQGWTKNEGAEKSSFDEIFHKFFPKGKKPLTFKEAMEMFAKEKIELKEAEETYEEDDEEF